MQKIITKAIGNLLLNYESDLEYIKAFQEWKKADTKTLKDSQHRMYQFLTEYNVRRWLNNADYSTLLNIIRKLSPENPNDFVSQLEGEISKSLTKKLQSLSSKVGMLYNHEIFLPIDKYVKIACFGNLNYHTYEDYLIAVENIMKKPAYQSMLDETLRIVTPLVQDIEQSCGQLPFDFETVRRNRMIDKILWTLGKDRITPSML